MLKSSVFRLSCWLMVFTYLASTLLIEANKHTYGIFDPKDEIILNRHIFARNTSQPTNYTIFYKYVRNKLAGTITYIDIDVQNCTSTGYIRVNNDDNNNNTKRQETVVQAVLEAINCTKLNVTAQIWGCGASRASLLKFDPLAAELYEDTVFEPKSFAFIYAHNETRSMNRFITIGQRQTNDILIKYDKITVTNELSEYPEYEIAYNAPHTFITQVAFKFNSPTAMAFLNSSFIQENSFNAIIYDLNRPQFTADINIYGYFQAKPPHYKSIITP